MQSGRQQSYESSPRLFSTAARAESQADAASVWRVVRARSASRAWLTATREAAVAAVDWSAGGVAELNRFGISWATSRDRVSKPEMKAIGRVTRHLLASL